jgi:hypothetical protein
VWLALDNGAPRKRPEHVLPELAAVVRFAADLGQRLEGANVDGVAGTVALSERLRAVLDGIAEDDILAARASVRALEAWLGELLCRVEELRAMKEIG